ncbi:hypothetical protein BGZ76_010895 [Entomortierella beljakovae]|nr:hypothetical protein BGZ76_010895 [Entomortierella beljakovae]
MLGPASLRLQQPAKPGLKTYGSRNKRGSDTTSTTGSAFSANASKQFNWDRIENERRERLEQAEARRSIQSGSNHLQIGQSDTNSSLPSRTYYSGTVLDPKARQDNGAESSTKYGSNSLYSKSKTVTTVPSTQESDSDNNEHLSQTRFLRHLPTPSRYTHQINEMHTSSTQDSDPDPEFGFQSQSRISGGSAIRSAIKQQGQTRRDDSTTSSMTEQLAEQTIHRRVMFQEKVFFEEEDPENDYSADDDEGDEVLFRTPSFNVLQRLRELPKPQLPKPQVNPFGFESLEVAESTQHPQSVQKPNLEKSEERLSSEGFTTSSSISTSKNPFLDSPTTKKSMEIINRRAQQIAEIQRLRKEKNDTESLKAGNNTSMEVERNGNIDNLFEQNQEEPRSSSSPPSTWDSEQDSDYISKHNTRQYTPEPQDTNHGAKEDPLDIALGKRISSIEITPRRLLAKQRKTTNVGFIPSAPSFRDSNESDSTDENSSLRQHRLFLDRDIPKDGLDDLDDLLKRARKSREFLASSSLISDLSLSKNPGSISAQSHSSRFDEKRDQRRVASMRSQFPEHGRSSLSSKHGAIANFDTYKGSIYEDLNNPFLVHRSQDESTLESDTKIISKQVSTKVPSLPLADHPMNHKDSPNEVHETLQYKKPERKIRSLRRPPAVLVNSRKSVLRPTVDDLLAICDQKFFNQFHCLDSKTDKSKRSYVGATPEQTKHNRDIIDFDALLPDCMVSSLSKIGEASYSEVYTVDLPEKRQKQGKATGYNDEFNLFESSRLNAYIRESMEDDFARSKEGGGNTKLVMKVMPFYDDQATKNESSQAMQERGRRSKVRRKAMTTLLELEDIYREAMVSTQIMHGWKGFIGSFGTLVVKGKYPKAFLSVWDSFKKERGTESERPDVFTGEQLYCIILLPYGGIDLEHCSLANWQQAWSVLAQVAASLEPKEQAPFWFEHRDLHWGNILVKGTQQEHIVFGKCEKSLGASNDSGGLDIEKKDRIIPTYGTVVQMIDFTLARVQGDKGNLIYMDLEKDQDLFQGQGDYQFDIYRKMRKVVGKDWAASRPRTNLLWLHYISDKLLSEKNLKKPIERSSKDISSSKRYSRAHIGTVEDEKLEMWCYERIQAVSKMNLDRLDPSGRTPSGTVLELLLCNHP